MPRSYRLGRRQGAVDKTRLAILNAARELVASGEADVSAEAVARRAGVSRITVYNQFGSKAGLLQEMAAEAYSRPAAEVPERTDPLVELNQRIAGSCSIWASDAALFRRLPRVGTFELASRQDDKELAERLSAADLLRPGCSLKEAEDVIAAVTSFNVFDRLHKDGRRSQGAVAEILMRLASTILDGQAPRQSP